MLAKLFSNGNLVAELEVPKAQPFIHAFIHDDAKPSGDDELLRACGITRDLIAVENLKTFKLTDVRTDLAIYDEHQN